MNYEQAKKLKDAGFPTTSVGIGDRIWINENNKNIVVSKGELELAYKKIVEEKTWYRIPTLSELIEACGDEFDSLELMGGKDNQNNKIWDKEKATQGQWRVTNNTFGKGLTFCWGHTPEEAVANLWITLNKK